MKQNSNNNLVTIDLFEKGLSEVKEQFKKYRDDILNKLDEVMGELENHRDERMYLKHDIKDHEARITKLEQASPSL